MTDPVVVRAATISDCGLYRYELARVWDPALPVLGWIMLNPSTADALVDDATIRKCMGFARRASFGGILVTNLFAYRATDPSAMKAASRSGVDIVGRENTNAIVSAARRCGMTIAAWGANGSTIRHTTSVHPRDEMVQLMLDAHGLGKRLFVLRWTKKGSPEHPLYVPYEQIDTVSQRPLIREKPAAEWSHPDTTTSRNVQSPTES